MELSALHVDYSFFTETPLPHTSLHMEEGLLNSRKLRLKMGTKLQSSKASSGKFVNFGLVFALGLFLDNDMMTAVVACYIIGLILGCCKDLGEPDACIITHLIKTPYKVLC